MGNYSRIGLYIILTILAFGGLYGGIMLILSPDGIALGMSTELLSSSSFIKDYLLPGWILTILFGALPLIAIYGIYKRKFYGEYLSIVLAIALYIWMGVQIWTIGFIYPPMQVAFIVLPSLILVCSVYNKRR